MYQVMCVVQCTWNTLRQLRRLRFGVICVSSGREEEEIFLAAVIMACFEMNHF